MTEIKPKSFRAKSVVSTLRASLHSHYDCLGNRIVIDAEGHSNEAIVTILEFMVGQLREKIERDKKL